MIICGVDPGLDGGIAILGEETICWPMPVISLKKGRDIDGLEVASILRRYKLDRVIIELVHALPGQGVTSMFNFGKGFGRLLGICEGLLIPYDLVQPQQWKKAMGCSGDKTSSIQRAKQIFPEISLLPTPRCKKPSDGMAEALLLADYGRRMYRPAAIGDIFA